MSQQPLSSNIRGPIAIPESILILSVHDAHPAWVSTQWQCATCGMVQPTSQPFTLTPTMWCLVCGSVFVALSTLPGLAVGVFEEIEGR